MYLNYYMHDIPYYIILMGGANELDEVVTETPSLCNFNVIKITTHYGTHEVITMPKSHTSTA